MTKPEDISPDPALEALFEQARGDGFTDAETDALWSRVAIAAGAGAAGAAVGAAGSAAASHGATATAVAATTGAKVAAWVVVGTLAIAGGTVAVVKGIDRGASPQAIAATTATATATPTATPTPTPTATATPTPTPTPTATATPTPTATAITTPTATATTVASPAAPSRARVERPAARDMRGASDTATIAAAPPSMNTPATSPAAPAAPPASGEGALLLRARRVLASEPQAALALTQEDERLFPAGDLAPEREVLAIEALARLGRTAEARSRFDAFRARFPQSPHVARLRALLDRP
jgi:hypothetical protein